MSENNSWFLTDRDEDSQYYNKKFKFDISYITSSEIRQLMRDYICINYRNGNRTLSKLSNDCYRFKYFQKYAELNEITSMTNISASNVDGFLSYLRSCTTISKKKRLSRLSQKGIFDTFKAIIHWSQIHRDTLAPRHEIFVGNEFRGIGASLKIDFIPDKIIEKINIALKNEDDVIVKYGIIILEATGIRIGDLLMLKTDCVRPHLINGFTMEWFDHKSRKERGPLPVSDFCAKAVERLLLATEPQRKINTELYDFLFIDWNKNYKTNDKVILVTAASMRKRFKRFVEKHEIYDDNGALYNLSAHQFRRTLATDMFSKGIMLNVIQEVLGHSTPITTKRYYADIKDRERAEMFKKIGVIGSISNLRDDVFSSQHEKKWFMDNHNNCIAGMSDGYCLNHISDGKICDRLLKRQKCYTCNRYITTPEFLEVHKLHLLSLQRQVKEGELFGQHYVEHFLPTIQILETIIRRLEAIQSGELQ